MLVILRQLIPRLNSLTLLAKIMANLVKVAKAEAAAPAHQALRTRRRKQIRSVPAVPALAAVALQVPVHLRTRRRRKSRHRRRSLLRARVKSLAFLTCHASHASPRSLVKHRPAQVVARAAHLAPLPVVHPQVAQAPAVALKKRCRESKRQRMCSELAKKSIMKRMMASSSLEVRRLSKSKKGRPRSLRDVPGESNSKKSMLMSMRTRSGWPMWSLSMRTNSAGWSWLRTVSMCPRLMLSEGKSSEILSRNRWISLIETLRSPCPRQSRSRKRQLIWCSTMRRVR